MYDHPPKHCLLNKHTFSQLDPHSLHSAPPERLTPQSPADLFKRSTERAWPRKDQGLGSRVEGSPNTDLKPWLRSGSAAWGRAHADWGKNSRLSPRWMAGNHREGCYEQDPGPETPAEKGDWTAADPPRFQLWASPSQTGGPHKQVPGVQGGREWMRSYFKGSPISDGTVGGWFAGQNYQHLPALSSALEREASSTRGRHRPANLHDLRRAQDGSYSVVFSRPLAGVVGSTCLALETRTRWRRRSRAWHLDSRALSLWHFGRAAARNPKVRQSRCLLLRLVLQVSGSDGPGIPQPLAPRL